MCQYITSKYIIEVDAQPGEALYYSQTAGLSPSSKFSQYYQVITIHSFYTTPLLPLFEASRARKGGVLFLIRSIKHHRT